MPRLSARDGAHIIGLAIAYAVIATIGLRLGATLHTAPPLWPAAGLAIAALCIGGVRLWPGVALGTLAAIAPRGNGAMMTIVITASTTAEAIAAALLLRAVTGFRSDLRRARDACALVIVGGIVAPAIGATIGAGAFAVTAIGADRAFASEWLDWFLGDVMGVIIFAPLVLAWARHRSEGEPARRVETLAFAFGFAVATAFALDGGSLVASQARPLIFITFPFIVWAALRLGLRLTMTAVAVLAVATILAAAMHLGVFAGAPGDVGAMLQAYLATTAATALIVASSSAEKRDAVCRLVVSERQLSMVFDSNSDTLLLFGVEGEDEYRIVTANRALRESLVWHRPSSANRELIGMPMRTFIMDVLGLSEDRVERNLASFRRAIATRAPLSYENMDWGRADEIAEVTLVPVFDAAGHCTHILRSSRDISARKSAEQSLRLHDFVLTNAPLGVLMLDASHRIIFANEYACARLGRSREQLLGTTIGDLDAHEPTAQWRPLVDLGTTLGQHSLEIEHTDADGGRHPLEVSIAVLPYGGQDMSCVFIRDVAERRRAEMTRRTLEAELFQAQKMEALGTLAGGIAHDFNNILAAIVGNAEMAQSELAPGHSARQDIAEVLRAARRARDLVMQILTFSRKQQPVRRPIRPADVVDDALRLLRATIPATVELRSEIADPTVHIYGEPTQLHQVLMNLCTNAAHAIGEQHGAITVTQTRVEIAASSLHGELLPGQYVCLTVNDTGHGMDRTTLEHVFEPFFTTKGPGVGTGLGLAVVHGIVKSHEGAVTVESAPGRGTTVRIFFPVLASQASPHPAETVTAPRGAGERVLFVDDEPSLTQVAGRMLERLGYRVEAMLSPTEALARFRADPAAFDLVISDLTMPGLTGAQLARELRHVRANVPVILSTGYLDRLDDEWLQSLPAGELLIKPYTAEALASAVRRALEAA
jgi:PAS domain S-box-containing protein